MTPTLERIIELLIDFTGTAGITEGITVETNLKTDLGFDSLDLTELVMIIEDEYNLEFSDDEAYGIVTVQDLLNTAIRLFSRN